MKEVLILGGTQFIGRNLVEHLIERKDLSITLFNRQKNNPDLFPDLKKIKGDRETDDIDQIAKKNWDVIIDVSSYFPNSLETLLQKIKGKVKRYIYVSTISVYDLEKFATSFIDETFETLACSEKERTDTTMFTYGKRKAECERILLKAEWLDKIVLRPSISFGKYDHTDRFYFWLYRIKKLKQFILPDKGKDKLTLTYAKDLALIIEKAMELEKHSIIYNATTNDPTPLNEIVNKITSALHSKAEALPLSAERLLSKEIIPGKDIPLWFGQEVKISNEKLKQEFKMEFTAIENAIQETASYYSNINWPKPKAGIDETREKEIISANKS